MITYNHILQGSEATEENALSHARGLDWSEVEEAYSPGFKVGDRHYIDEVNGIGVWYNWAAD